MDTAAENEPAWTNWRRPAPTRAQQRNDVLVGLGVLAGALAAIVLVNSMGAFAYGTAPSMPEQLGWVALLTMPLVVRRRFPTPVLFVVGAVFIAAQTRRIGDQLVPLIALFLAMYSAGAWEQNRFRARWARIGVIATMFVWIGIMVLRSLFDPSQNFPGAAGPLDPTVSSVLYNIGVNVLFFLSAYFFGDQAWLSARRQAELESRAEQLVRSQEQNTRTAIVAERVRVARDLHDIVAHHVSVTGIQAGAARRVLDTDHDLARGALETVESNARATVEDLRGLLGVLRAEPEAEGPLGSGGATNAHSASPGLEDVSELLETARAAGLRVEYGVYGGTQGRTYAVPAGIALSAYRVIQEALTNTVKHAAARMADVRVRYLDHELEVEVTDDGRGTVKSGAEAGTGLGLVGMRERVTVHGGTFETGPRRGGGYRVRARFPVQSPSAGWTEPTTGQGHGRR